MWRKYLQQGGSTWHSVLIYAKLDCGIFTFQCMEAVKNTFHQKSVKERVAREAEWFDSALFSDKSTSINITSWSTMVNHG
jgi:hypothetical protein